MGHSRTALGVVCLSSMLLMGNALYFHIKEGESKCFIEEVPDETMVQGQYKTLRHNPDGSYESAASRGVGMHVRVRDPSDNVIMSKDYEAEGRFAFSTHEPGEHQICLYSNTTSGWFGGEMMRIHLKLTVGEASNDYDQIQKTEQLSQVETRLYQLISQVKQISNEQHTSVLVKRLSVKSAR